MAEAQSFNDEYDSMLSDTSKQLNKLLAVPFHYQCVYWKRQRDWVIFAMAFATARTRLETVLSCDRFIRQAIDRWAAQVADMDKCEPDAWRAKYKESDVAMETLACLFLPPEIEEFPERLVTHKTPMAFSPLNVLQQLSKSDEALADPDDLLKLLLDRDVRRVCTVHKILVQLWASVLEAANWWRLCVKLDPKPESPDMARRTALRMIGKLRDAYKQYLETFSPFIDNTDDSDDYEVRAEIVRQNFKMDAITYHRSFETIRDRSDKEYRIIESRKHVLE